MVAGGGSEVTHCYRFSMLAAHNSFTLPCVCSGELRQEPKWPLAKVNILCTEFYEICCQYQRT